jgi:hypothetical protein
MSFKRRFSIALCLVVFSISTVTVEPQPASAGVLTRGGSNQISVRVPRIRSRSVRSTTAVQKATSPDLEYHGQTFDKIYARMQKDQRRYEQQLQRWQRKKERAEERAKRLEERERQRRERETAKKRAEALRLQRHNAASQGASGESDASIAKDPRAWFTKRIAQVDQGGSLSVKGREPEQAKEAPAFAKPQQPENADKSGHQLTNDQKQPPSMWTHIWRALGLI